MQAKKKILKTDTQMNKERYDYYRTNKGTYNYGIENPNDGLFSIYRRSDDKLLHQFNVKDFISLIKPVLTGKHY